MPTLYSRVDESIEIIAKRLADEDHRTVSSEIAWLIRQEWARRKKRKASYISVVDAMMGKEEAVEETPSMG